MPPYTSFEHRQDITIFRCTAESIAFQLPHRMRSVVATGGGLAVRHDWKSPAMIKQASSHATSFNCIYSLADRSTRSLLQGREEPRSSAAAPLYMISNDSSRLTMQTCMHGGVGATNLAYSSFGPRVFGTQGRAWVTVFQLRDIDMCEFGTESACPWHLRQRRDLLDGEGEVAFLRAEEAVGRKRN